MDSNSRGGSSSRSLTISSKLSSSYIKSTRHRKSTYKRREEIKKKSIRTVLMAKAEEYVRKFNLDNPATPIEALTSDVLELVANKRWSEVRITQTIIN